VGEIVSSTPLIDIWEL